MQIHPLCNISKIAFDASLLSFTAFRQYIYIGFNAVYHFKNTTSMIIVDSCARYIQALQAERGAQSSVDGKCARTRVGKKGTVPYVLDGRF